MLIMFLFFFSSRRRHTRLTCDWSSDVCSSDLARVVVLGLALFPSDLDAVDPAVAGVDHLHVVDQAAEDSRAAGRVGTDPVTVHRDELLVLRISGARDGEGRGAQERGASDFAQHWNPPSNGNLPVSTGYRNEQPRLL